MADNFPAASCLARIQEILTRARHGALQTVNAAMLAAYWHVGREIVEEEQRGQDRAGYGERLIQELSEQLTAQFGRGFSVANLKLIRQFYFTYRDRSPQIGYTVSSQFATIPVAAETSNEASITPREPDRLLRFDLSWS